MSRLVLALFSLLLLTPTAFASEADLKVPSLTDVAFSIFGTSISGMSILYSGLAVCVLATLFGLLQYKQTKALPVHASMQNVSNIIWETCKSYLWQQGKFLVWLWLLIAACIVYYFGVLEHKSAGNVALILASSALGILGSYGVAWFGIRINTTANSRAAFASLRGAALPVLGIPLKSGMSVGLLLVSVELFFMICILAFLPVELVGPCFIGFAIGESLGASVLRICGGIFTKIADIGADLMKIVFKLPEDDPKNPGVIADCTGDNAGDSVGPTADGFETYGVTGVALIAFLAYSMGESNPSLCATLIVWLFTMRILMVITSLVSYLINEAVSKAKFGGKAEFDEEAPLTSLVWITSIISILVTFVASYLLLGSLTVSSADISTVTAAAPTAAGTLVDQTTTIVETTSVLPDLWWILSVIISLGTIAGALIPELTKAFTSTNSRHVKEVVNASKQGGASLCILSGLVAGNFSAFWKGLVILSLMGLGWWCSTGDDMVRIMPAVYPFAAPIFAFGLIAFGFLGMGPVTIAVDSFGPVTDNAQSVYELSQIEKIPNIKEEIKSKFGFTPDFTNAKHLLEKGDGAGNTFKATAKPVLIGTAVVGATTMVFGIILALIGVETSDILNGVVNPADPAYAGALAQAVQTVVGKLSVVQPAILLGLLAGGSVIYWFTGASTQAVVTGAYRAVVYIKENINLEKATASVEDSKEVVRICTVYAQKGMINIFIVVFCLSLALPFFDPFFFIGYLIAIAFFGLFQAIFMANAGGSWDNAKKIVEVDMRAKGTELHAATVVGDTVGDPFKDTSSVSLNPVIKFTTLFGLLAVEIAVTMENQTAKMVIGSVFTLTALIFVYRSFYSMRIPEDAKS
ncbi:MAG: sodium-translocating pyrophosphatase [Phycisphaerales bacterium]|nr:sodium-translocating pyrophosphatase [Phycisphaerales bacterium]